MNFNTEEDSGVIGKIKAMPGRKKPGEFRIGKTRRDRHNGSHARNASNKQARADWNNETTGKRSNDGKSFPYGTCNGKRNRALKERISKG